MKKVKQPLKRFGVAQRVPGILGSQIFMTFGTGRQHYAPATFNPRSCSWYSFSLGAESTPRAMVGSEGKMSLKNPVTKSGIDPGTVRLVAQRLNHYAIPRPLSLNIQGYRKRWTGFETVIT
jgi:hypothetical protein